MEWRLPETLQEGACNAVAVVGKRSCGCSHHRPYYHIRFHLQARSRRQSRAGQWRKTTGSRSGIYRWLRCCQHTVDGQIFAANCKELERMRNVRQKEGRLEY